MPRRIWIATNCNANCCIVRTVPVQYTVVLCLNVVSWPVGYDASTLDYQDSRRLGDLAAKLRGIPCSLSRRECRQFGQISCSDAKVDWENGFSSPVSRPTFLFSGRPENSKNWRVFLVVSPKLFAGWIVCGEMVLSADGIVHVELKRLVNSPTAKQLCSTDGILLRSAGVLAKRAHTLRAGRVLDEINDPAPKITFFSRLHKFWTLVKCSSKGSGIFLCVIFRSD